MRRKEGAFIAAQAAVTFAVLLVVALPAMNQTGIASSQSSTSAESESTTTITSPCNSPGVYCGAGLTISNGSLTSSSTIGRNYSLLDFTFGGTYPGLVITILRVYLSNATHGDLTVPPDLHGLWLVGAPTWSGKSGATFSLEIPPALHLVKGAQCELWVDAFYVTGPMKGDNWARQNMTIG